MSAASWMDQVVSTGSCLRLAPRGRRETGFQSPVALSPVPSLPESWGRGRPVCPESLGNGSLWVSQGYVQSGSCVGGESGVAFPDLQTLEQFWVHIASRVFIDGDSDSSSRASMSGPEGRGLALGWPSAASSHVGATLCPGRAPPQAPWAPRQGQTEARPPFHWGGPAVGAHPRQGPAGVTSCVLTWP